MKKRSRSIVVRVVAPVRRTKRLGRPIKTFVFAMGKMLQDFIFELRPIANKLAKLQDAEKKSPPCCFLCAWYNAVKNPPLCESTDDCLDGSRFIKRIGA